MPPTTGPASSGELDTSGPPVNLDLVFTEREFCDKSSSTRWYTASGVTAITHPPSDLPVRIGDLYVYTAKASEKIYTWVYWNTGWRRIFEGGHHPELANRCLVWRSISEPSWVTANTWTTYQGQKRQIVMKRKVSYACHSLLPLPMLTWDVANGTSSMSSDIVF